jgi:hypothetical protein
MSEKGFRQIRGLRGRARGTVQRADVSGTSSHSAHLTYEALAQGSEQNSDQSAPGEKGQEAGCVGVPCEDEDCKHGLLRLAYLLVKDFDLARI